MVGQASTRIPDPARCAGLGCVVDHLHRGPLPRGPQRVLVGEPGHRLSPSPSGCSGSSARCCGSTSHATSWAPRRTPSRSPRPSCSPQPSSSLISLLFPGGRLMPASVPLAAGAGTLALAVGARLVWRSLHEATVRPDAAQPALILGAGSAGAQLIANMLSDPDSPFLPVGLLDDDPAKRHLRIQGVRMLGNRTSLEHAKEQTGAEVLIIAIPSARSELFRDVSESASGRGPAREGAAHPARDPQRQGGPARPARHRHHRPPGPRPGGHRRGRLGRLHHGQAGAGDRRGRLDRLGAVPAAGRASTRRSC